MNFKKNGLALGLLVLLAQPKQTEAAGFKTLSKAAKVLLISGGLWYGPKMLHYLMAKRINDMNREELNNLKKISKSLTNSNIRATDNPEDVAKKWGMKGWRIKGSMFAYRPDVSMPDAIDMYLDEPTVVECLYNDLKQRQVYLVKGKDPIAPTFAKPDKNAYKQNLKGAEAKPITVCNTEEVPSMDTLKFVNECIDSELKDLLKKMEELDKKELLGKDESGKKYNTYSGVLITTAQKFKKDHTSTYKHYIKDLVKKIQDNKDLSDGYKTMLIKSVESFEHMDVTDIPDLYLFNHEQLFALKAGVKSLCDEFAAACKKTYEDSKQEPKSDVKKEKDPFRNLYHYMTQNAHGNWNALKDRCFKGYDLSQYFFPDEDLENKLFEETAKTFFNVAVSYARLVRIQKIVQKIINMAGGFEEQLTNEQKLQKKKDEVKDKVGKLIKLTEKLESNKPRVDYIVLEYAFLEVHKIHKELYAYDLVQIYGKTLVDERFKKMIARIKQDIKNIATYFGPNTPMKNMMDDDIDDILGMGGGFGHRPAAGVAAYQEGYLNDASVAKLQGICRGWLIGLKDLEKLSQDK